MVKKDEHGDIKFEPRQESPTAPMIYDALIKAQEAVEVVKKEAKNKFSGYDYRDIDSTMTAAHAAFVKAGIVMVPEVLKKEQAEKITEKNDERKALIYTVLTIRYTLYAPDGSSISSIVLGEALDTGDKGIAKCLSQAYKYCIFQVLSLPTDDFTDNEIETLEITPPPDMGTPDERAELMQEIASLATDAGMTLKDISDRIKGDITTLPIHRLEACIEWLHGQASKPDTAGATPEMADKATLMNKVLTEADKAGISIQELEKQAGGEKLVDLPPDVLTICLEYIHEMADRTESA